MESLQGTRADGGDFSQRHPLLLSINFFVPLLPLPHLYAFLSALSDPISTISINSPLKRRSVPSSLAGSWGGQVPEGSVGWAHGVRYRQCRTLILHVCRINGNMNEGMLLENLDELYKPVRMGTPLVTRFASIRLCSNCLEEKY